MDNMDFERILHIDLDRDLCRILKSDTAGRPLTEISFSAWREELASGGLVHPEDREQLLAFLAPERLRAAAQAEPRTRWTLYRRASGDGFRWNFLELLWTQEDGYLLRALDIHDIVREGQAREGLDPHTLERLQQDVEMAGILKSRFKMMNTVDLATGQCRRVDLSAPDRLSSVMTGDYTDFILRALEKFVHPEDAEGYWAALSLDHLREQAARTEDYFEEVCVYRQRGETLRWIELRVIYARQKDGQISVNILGQDVTREKRQEESRRQVLEERDTMISSLSTLFFSTYYVDLEQNSFRAVTQLRRVGDLLGEEMNYNAGLQIYANHFVHPDDREEYLQVMNCEHLRDTLRWWHPYVAMEYRKLPDLPGDEEYKWVRATAVLARSGTDDLPKTAVYVAQSIAENRRNLS